MGRYWYLDRDWPKRGLDLLPASRFRIPTKNVDNFFALEGTMP